MSDNFYDDADWWKPKEKVRNKIYDLLKRDINNEPFFAVKLGLKIFNKEFK